MAFCQELTKEGKWLLKSSKKLNSDLDNQQKQQLLIVKLFNSYLSTFSNESLIASGSCVEGCKVNVDDVKGDLDLMVICGSVELREDQFEYSDEYPAFLCIKGNSVDAFKHAELTKGGYVPTSILKNFSKSFFYMLRVFLMWIGGLPSMTSDGNASITRLSNVGIESVDVTGVSGLGAIVNEKTGILDIYPTLLNFFPRFIETLSTIGRKHGEKVHIYPEIELAFKSFSTIASTIKNSPKNKKELAFKRGTFEALSDLLRIMASCFAETNDNSTTKAGSNPSEANECRGVIIEELDTTSELNYIAASASYNGNTATQYAASNPFDDIDMEHRFNNDLDTSSDEETVGDYSGGQQLHILPSVQEHDKSPPITDCAEVTNSSSEVHETDDEVASSPVLDTCLDQSETADDSMTSVTASYVLRSTDLVPAFRCIDWPRAAVEWITRSRVWPSQDICNIIVHAGCFIIAKAPPIGACSPDALDRYFRLSFSQAELSLADAMLPVQKVCLKILKAYHIGYLKCDPKVLTSYHWKTAMLWISEQKPDWFWVESNLLIAVTGVLDFMLECLENVTVPHYFVRRMNLISGCDPASIAAVKCQIQDIRKCPALYLRNFLRNPPKPQPCVVEVSRDDIDLMRRADVAEPWERTVEEALHGLEDLALYCSKRGEKDLQTDMNKFASAASTVLTETMIYAGASEKRITSFEQYNGFVKDGASLLFKYWTDSKSVTKSDVVNVVSQGFVQIGNILSLEADDKQSSNKQKSNSS